MKYRITRSIKKILIYFENFLTFFVSLIFKDKFNKKKYRFSIQEVWYSPWELDKKFNEIYLIISKYTLLSKKKLYCLDSISKQICKLNGSFLEIGTLKGGSGALLASNMLSKELILWDNWGGDIKNASEDKYFVNKIYAKNDDFEIAKNLIKKFTDQKNIKVTFINKTFPNLDTINELNDKISLVHFDIYNKDAFEKSITYLWPKIVDGGVFIVSAYGSISLDSLTEAVNDYVKNKEDCIFLNTFAGLGVIIKKSPEFFRLNH